jgi:hypothetical protein
LVLPPFEGPDESANTQYVRYIVDTGSLPKAVPTPDSEWFQGGEYYQWSQQPLHYLMLAGVVKALRLPLEPHRQPLNGRSRLRGGREPTVFDHSGPAPVPLARRTMRIIRAISVALGMVTVALVALMLSWRSPGHPWGVAAAATAIPLVPHWGGVMSTNSVDVTATLLATLSVAALIRLAHSPTPTRAVAAGLGVGLAAACKQTTLFLWRSLRPSFPDRGAPGLRLAGRQARGTRVLECGVLRGLSRPGP